MSGAEPVLNETLWWITLGAGLAVTLVVAVLLHLIVASARRIHATVADIWVAGPLIANNTAHVDVIRRINHVAEDIRQTADNIEAHTRAIHEHANGCPGCPRCVIGWS